MPPTEPKTPDQLLDMALARPVQFPPGAKMEYTNTNYIIAGMILEKVTGRPAVDEITWRTIVPFGLFDTYFP
ncbi:serine hydrolase domain-containing protein, partial [Mycolicibacterium elephantis]